MKKLNTSIIIERKQKTKDNRNFKIIIIYKFIGPVFVVGTWIKLVITNFKQFEDNK